MFVSLSITSITINVERHRFTCQVSVSRPIVGASLQSVGSHLLRFWLGLGSSAASLFSHHCLVASLATSS